MKWMGLVLAAALAACSSEPSGLPGLVAGQGGSDAGGGGGAPSGAGGSVDEVPGEEDPFEAPPEVPPLAQEIVDALAQEIDQALDGPGGTNSALIVGAQTGQVIYERNPDGLRKPASNTKLFTTAAAFAGLGEEHQSQSRVYATEDASDGVVDGNIVLVCEHDFTSSSFFHGYARESLDLLAGELAAGGLSEITGAVRVQGEGVWDGYQFAYYDAAQNRAALANAFRAALVDRGVTVGGGTTTGGSFDEPAGTEIATWASLPLATTAFPINVVSHNEFADVLARHVGYLNGGGSTYGAGEAAVLDRMSELGVDTSGLSLNDGSGLSHDNRVSARQVVGLLAGMLARPEGPAWMRTFAVSGARGTLGGRMAGANTYGRFWGKTGSLTGVITLSGVLEHRHDGQRYLVSLLMNEVASQPAARSAHDAVVSALARDHRELGPRPAAPIVGCAKNDANGATAIVGWSQVEGAEGYLVWRSRDGRTWDRPEARFVTTTSHRTLGFEGSDALFLRVTAVGQAGESDPSDVVAVRIADDPSSVLVVDANDRWQGEPVGDNLLERGHDFVVRVAEAIESAPFDTCANEALAEGDLAGYEAAIWLLGNESTDHETIDAAEQEILRAFVDGGGSLLVSGAEIGWDLEAQGDAGDLAFLHEVLGASYVADDAGTATVYGAGPLASLERLSFYNPGLQAVGFPDVLAPGPGASIVLAYPDGGAAAVKRDGVLALGFPLENVDTRAHRSAIIALALAPGG